MTENNLIRGAGGGGKGGDSARAAVEAKNTLRSRQYARLVDIICEGEIEGLVGLNISPEYAERSIYFDGVPLRNEHGTPSFDINAFSWAFVPGVQNQPVIPTGGTVASEIDVNQEVKAGNTGGGPVIRSIPETYIDACRVTVTIPRLTTQDTTNGDINGGKVKFAIDVQNNGGGFVEVLAPTIEGKTNSPYQRSYEFDLPAGGPWDIRVRRLTSDADTSNIQNQLYWATLTKIVKETLNYPNTALMGLKVDSALFSRVPSRAYKMRLLKVRVPSNYNPETRTYAGLWDGTFKVAWTDNPAWCWYDLATNTRYGLGEYIEANSIDKWTLYAIGQYCDELVPDGAGGLEPRFTCNLLLNTREEALKVLMNIASIFRGIVYWHSNTIFCSQDKPSNPVKLFTPSNVVDGVFLYSGSARQARHTVAMVSWNDPDNLYKQTVEYVEDRESIVRLGVRETEVTAMGCTSRSQANRLGRWILLTEREETDIVTFKTGLEGCGVMPGEIIQTTDPARASTRLGGRLVSATLTQVTLDAPVTLEAGKDYTIAIVLPSGVIEERAIAWTGTEDTTLTTLTLGTELQQVPTANAVWILQTATLVPELWRVVSILESEPGIVEISAIEHVPGKYAAIEQNLKLEPRPTSQINIKPSAVTNLTATTDVKKLNALEYTTRIFVSWTPPKDGAARYIVTWRRGEDNDKTSIVNDPAFDIDDVPAGTFEISVVAENAIGLRGPATTITHIVAESDVEPDVQNLRLNPDFLGQDCPIIWDRLDWAIKYTVQVYSGTTLLREVPVETNSYTYTYAQNLADDGPRRNLTFKVKAQSWRGESANWATLDASNPAPATPQGVSLEAGPGQVSIFAERPSDPDLDGMIVWMYTDLSVPTTSGNIVYKGKDNAFMKVGLQPGIPVYFKVAFYDIFGTTDLNISNSVSATPLATGGILKVTELPENPETVNGETAVWLDVDESTGQRGLWGWNGTTWQYTRDGGYLVANSVTADKINATNLSAISANMGTITSGNITLAADGFIKGGATNYTSGTGFWMGYHDENYKWRVGAPGSSGAEWDGSSFKIYGPDGSVTIQSGASIAADWTTLLNKPTSLSGINSSEANKLAAIEAGATVGADGTNLKAGMGVNLIFNGDYTDGLAGTAPGYQDGGIPVTLGLNLSSNYQVIGEGTAYITIAGSPPNDSVFQANIFNGAPPTFYPVQEGQRYEISAYLSTVRCKSARLMLSFYDVSDALIDPIYATSSVTGPGTTIYSLKDLNKVGSFVTAPTGAVKAVVVVQGLASGESNPYVFFSRVYFGEAGVAQTTYSPWVPGRGISQVTQSNVSTYISNAAIGNAQIDRATVNRLSVNRLDIQNQAVSVGSTYTSAQIAGNLTFSITDSMSDSGQYLLMTEINVFGSSSSPTAQAVIEAGVVVDGSFYGSSINLSTLPMNILRQHIILGSWNFTGSVASFTTRARVYGVTNISNPSITVRFIITKLYR